jgi:pyruvate kinase
VEGSDERTKTKIVCTIGPSTSSRDMIWKLAQLGMNVARLNMSHGDHTSHQKTIHFVKQYNSQFQDRVISIMLDTKVKSISLFFFFYNCIAQLSTYTDT